MYNIEGANSGHMAFTSGGLAQGTTATTFKTVNTVTYTIDGVLTSKVAADNLPFSAGHKPVPPGSQCIFGVWLDSAGAVSTSQGYIMPNEGSVAPLPDFLSDKCCVGLVKVQTNSATTFTPNTTNLNAAGVTSTYFNTSQLPGKAK